MVTDADRIVELGYVSGLHGVHGWVKLYSLTQPPAAILNFPQLLVAARENAEGAERDRATRWQSRVVREGKSHGRRIIACFEGVVDRDQAAGLIGCKLAVRRSELPRLADDEWYWTDLVGLKAVDAKGAHLGVVSRIFDTGANDVLVIESPRGEILVPFVQGRYVLEIDLAARRIQVDWEPEFD